ncbi:MAG: anti-sigma factor [Actinomycetota bacterium]|nr:anti-sigma factor [Actinomycetota bacterium]
MTEATTAHDELRGLLAPYAIGVASSAEETRVRRHLESCQECLEELSLLEEGIHVLASADAAELPQGLEAKILATADAAEFPQGLEAKILATARAGRPRERARSRSRLAAAATVAAVTLAIAVAAGTAMWSRFRAANEELTRRNQALELLLREEGIALSGASALAKLVPRDGRAVFIASGLPEAPGSRVYQLWLKDGSRLVGVTTFESAGDAVVLELSRPFDEFDGALVTIEPEGGSRQPTGAPVVDSI